MLRWNAQWRLNLDIANVTSAFSAIMSPARCHGKLSRALVAVWTSVLNTFPISPTRKLVAGIPARMMRVGFVGELGYELHVPSPLMGELWDRLLKSGEAHGIRPLVSRLNGYKTRERTHHRWAGH